MTDVTYDPETPFVFRFSGGDPIHARFRNKHDAENYAENYYGGSVIDTTPKPEFEDGFYLYANSGIYHFENGKWRDPSNDWQETTYPSCLLPSELRRLVPEGEVK